MASIRPLQDRLIIKRIIPEDREQIRGGIIIPDTAKSDPPKEGEVIAVGAGKKLDSGERVPMDVKVGDHVLIGKYAGIEIRINDDECVILKEDEVLGVIERASESLKAKGKGR